MAFLFVYQCVLFAFKGSKLCDGRLAFSSNYISIWTSKKAILDSIWVSAGCHVQPFGPTLSLNIR